LKFDSEYDFDKANEEFQEVLNKLNKTKIDDGSKSEENGETGGAVVGDEGEEINQEPEEGEIEEDEKTFYNKSTSFFDSISCEALERSKGKVIRNDWRAEKKLNKETFGVAGNRRYNYSGGRGYGYRGGRGGYQGNQGGGQGYGMGNRGFRGGGLGGNNFGRGNYGRGRRGLCGQRKGSSRSTSGGSRWLYPFRAVTPGQVNCPFQR